LDDCCGLVCAWCEVCGVSLGPGWEGCSALVLLDIAGTIEIFCIAQQEV
jgi:hypothetical protein